MTIILIIVFIGEQLQQVVRNTMNLDAKVAGDVMTPIQNVYDFDICNFL